jgi:exodeoxyribonuclease-3
VLVGDLNIAPLATDVWNHRALLKVVTHTPGEVAALAEFLIAIMVIQVWIRPAQQGFRQRQGLSRWRSLLAQTLALLSLPIVLLIYYVAYYGLVKMSG